ncbi:MAG: hypothetical protein KKB37_11460 [Alphaproteobacteria bacterium]|nr:hypothetical protein [Alphaproteobacteria bacterium]
MKFSPVRALVFAVAGLPVGFILTALCFAVAEQPILAGEIFPWALAFSGVVGVIGGAWKLSD